MKKIHALFVLGLLVALFTVTARSDEPDESPWLSSDEKLRGKSFEQWNLLYSQWAIVTGFNDTANLPNTIRGVRFLPNFGPQFDVLLSSETPFVSPPFFFWGELYDDGTQDLATDPIVDFILETTYVETRLDGKILVSGFLSDLSDLYFGPAEFDEPLFYDEPQPRGPELNAVAALFLCRGIGGVYHPLPAGEHTLQHTVNSLFFGAFETTFNILVIDDEDDDDEDDDDDDEDDDDDDDDEDEDEDEDD